LAVKDLQENNQINETLLLLDKQLKPFRNKSGSFLEVELRDSTGSIRGRLWENGEEVYQRLSVGNPVEVTGRIQEFMGELQIILDSIEDSHKSCSPEDFMPFLENYQEIKEEFLEQLEELKRRASFSAEEIKVLLDHVFETRFLEEFCKTPAAIKYHHAYLGGLMHHTLNVVRNAEALAKNYPEADLLLTLTGAFLHDTGKVEEYSFSTGLIETSSQGILLGHIILGIRRLQEAIRKLREKGVSFSEELEKLLLHIVTSHHSEGEWGSPRQPAVLEAFLVHQADLVDAEAYKFINLSGGEGGTCAWSNLLRRNVYIKKNNWDTPF